MADPPRGSSDSQRSGGVPAALHPITSNGSESAVISTPTTSAPRSPSMRIPSPSVSHGHGHGHRPSLSDALRGIPPPSPRSSRHASISAPAVQALLDNPPKPGPDAANPAFVGRSWQNINVGELVDPSQVKWAEVGTGIEDATNYLIESRAAVLLIRATPTDKAAVATFDYKDLNQYLLFATGNLRPDAEHLSFYQDLAKKAQAGKKIPLREAKSLGSTEPFIMLPHTAKLTKAVEAFGSGVHRLVIVREWTNEVCGLLSQSHLVKFLWDNGQSFPRIEQLYPQTLQELSIGSQANLISINGDRPLREALLLMDSEGVTSLAVVDNQMNVVGNISTVDVKLLTKASSAPLLQNTCIHFISVILSSRGVADGQDSFPVFHIPPHATLAHAVAKLVATKSHRLWITTPPSPAASGPPTPSIAFAPTNNYASALANATPSGPPAAVPPSPSAFTTSPPSVGSAPGHFASGAHAPPGTTGSSPPAPFPLVLGNSPPSPAAPLAGLAPSISAAALPGAAMSGRLSGVISLTDVLNVCARASGLNPGDLGQARRGRRRSSSSSMKGSGSVILG